MPDGPNDVYDNDVWDAVDRWPRHERRRLPEEVASGWRAGLGATALMTAVALGVQDVLEPKRDDPIIEEIDLDGLWSSDLPVVYHHVPGAPKASRAIVRPWLFSVVVGLIVIATLAATTRTAVAGPIGPHQHFEGVVNGHTTDPVVYTACPGPAVPGRTGPIVAHQRLAVARVRNGTGNTGVFSQVYAWFAQDSSSNTPTQLKFTAYRVKQEIPSSIRVPCDGKGEVQFSSCPYGAPCAAGFVPDVVTVSFINLAD